MTKDDAKHLHVTDLSCTDTAPKRTHEIMVHGEKITVTFEHGKKTVLPFEQGLKFHKDGFRVEEIDGSSLSLPAITTEGIAAQLAKDECVAKYTELTFASLKVRAAAKSGGDIYADAEESDKDDVIAFLIGEPPVSKEDETAPAKIENDGTAGDNDLLEDDGEEDGIVPPAPFITQEAFEAKYGISYTDLMNGLMAAYNAASYAADPDTKKFSLLNAGGTEIAYDTLDNLIANMPKPAPVTETAPPATPPAPPAEAPNDLGAGTGGSDAPKENASPAETKGGDDEKSGTDGSDDRKFSVGEVKMASDEAMELAAEYGIDLKDVTGTGAGGNIKKGDIKAFIAEKALQPVAK